MTPLSDIHNPEYYYYAEHDCANFVSQCVHTGGYEMTDVWYNDPYFSQGEGYSNLTATQYNSLSDEEKRQEDMVMDRITSYWSGANDQYHFFKDPVNGYTESSTIDIAHDESGNLVAAAIQQAKAEGNPIRPGDTLYWHMPGSSDAYHATIITDVTDDMIYYGGHSGCCIRKSLVEGMTGEAPYKGAVTVTIVRMSDYALYNEE